MLKADEDFVWANLIRRKGGPAKGAAKKQLRLDVRKRFPAPSAAEIKLWNSARDGNTAEMDALEVYSARTGIPASYANHIIQVGWMDSREQLSLKGAVMAKSKGVGAYAKTRSAATKRTWTKVTSGKTQTVRVPRACALVQAGEKKGRVRRGCRLTKTGAQCDILVRLPAEAKIGPTRRMKNSDGKMVRRRRTVVCS